MVKIRWDELSHMGLERHKVVLLWYLVNGVINIERCDRVIHKGDGRMHFSEALMHDEISNNSLKWKTICYKNLKTICLQIFWKSICLLTL